MEDATFYVLNAGLCYVCVAISARAIMLALDLRWRGSWLLAVFWPCTLGTLAVLAVLAPVAMAALLARQAVQAVAHIIRRSTP